MSGYLPSYSQSVQGAASTVSAVATTLIAAPSEGAICVSSLQLGRTDAGAAAITVAFNDLASTIFVLPSTTSGGGIRDFTFDAPLVCSAQQALTFQASSAVTTLFASAQGYLKQ